MIHDYLKAGYPALCVLTQEPHRAEQMLSSITSSQIGKQPELPKGLLNSKRKHLTP